MTLNSSLDKSVHIEPLINEYMTLIDGKLDQLVPQIDTPYSQLFQAARYSLVGGGKRLRPILALATAEMLGVPPSTAVHSACALELVHTYSLIHDDLPCMDDDDFRRGKPSLHKAFPESHAVLTGDFLLTLAFEVVASDPNLHDAQKVTLIKVLTKGAGGHGMIAGQIMDIEAENYKIDLERLQQIHCFKTMALISASISFGATIGNACELKTSLLDKFSKDFGLCFQIIDDIYDITKGLKSQDASYSSDLKNNKCTYATLLGVDVARQKAAKLLESAKLQLDQLPNSTVLRQIADHYLNGL